MALLEPVRFVLRMSQWLTLSVWTRDVRSRRARASIPVGALLSAFLMLGALHGGAEEPSSLVFEILSIEDGLSQNAVNCVFQDRQGFLWFGTDDGLNRFDGLEFTLFRCDPFDDSTLRNNSVNTITQDHLGMFWIGTKRGISCLDPATMKFGTPLEDPSLSQAQVQALIETEDGELWIGTSEGLFRHDAVRGQTDTILMQGEVVGDVRALLEDGQGVMWVGSEAGLVRVAPGRDVGELFATYADVNRSAHLAGVHALCEDRAGRLWVGTSGSGLIGYDASRRQVHEFRGDPENPSGLSHPRVSALCEDRAGHLWVGTWNGGLNRYEDETGRFERWVHNPGDGKGLGGNYINTVVEDRSAILWIGTSGGGLSKLDLDRPRFQHYRQDPDNPNTLNDNFIWAIHEDSDGVLWIGTDTGGLNRVDRDSGTFRTFQHDASRPDSLSNNEVRAIAQDPRGILWLGILEGGLDRFDPEKGTCRHFRHDPGDPASLTSNLVTCLEMDGENSLWIGTIDHGLNRFDLQSERFTAYPHDPLDPDSLIHGTVNAVYSCRSGLWIATDGGLDRMRDANTPVFEHFIHDPNCPQSLSYPRVFCVFEDSRGILWAGTYGGGLNQLHRESGTFSHFTEHEGLANNSIYGILEDDDGCLWISTNGGLSKFNPTHRTFKNYDVGDGLQSNEFDRGAYLKSPSGEMFFGGINGLNTFLPSEITSNTFLPPVVITDFKLFSKSVPIGPDQVLKQHISQSQEIRLTHDQNVFSFEFAALNYRRPNRNQYAYRMVGFDGDWTYSRNRRFVTYTNMPPGNFRFEVKASNHDGVWNEQGTALRIHIRPPFWRNPWFVFCVLALAATAILTAYKLRVRALEQRRALLEHQVLLRTRELNAEKERVEQQNRDLQDKNQELLTLEKTIQAINREVDLERLLRATLHQARALFPKAEKGVFLIREGDEFIYAAVDGYDEALFQNVSYSVEEAVDRYASEATRLDEGVNLIQNLERLPTPQPLAGYAPPQCMLTMSIILDAQVEGFLVLDSTVDPDAFVDSDLTKLRRFRKHAISALEKAKRVQELKETAQYLKETRDRVIEAAHLAGMADLAANVLHEMGNSFNSLNVSLDIARQLLDNPNLNMLRHIVEIVGEHRENLAQFMTSHRLGKNLPEILKKLLSSFEQINAELTAQVAQLGGQVDQIHGILCAQRELAFQDRIRQTVQINRLLQEVLEIQREHLARAKVQVTTEFNPLPAIETQKTKLMYVFISLINHTLEVREAEANADPTSLVIRSRRGDRDWIRVEFCDPHANAVPEDLARAFRQGDSAGTHRAGLGLHYGANAVGELGGSMRIEKSESGPGTVTIVQVPVNQNANQG